MPTCDDEVGDQHRTQQGAGGGAGGGSTWVRAEVVAEDTQQGQVALRGLRAVGRAGRVAPAEGARGERRWRPQPRPAARAGAAGGEPPVHEGRPQARRRAHPRAGTAARCDGPAGAGMTGPDDDSRRRPSSSTQTRLATASTASARSTPASSRASATKAAAADDQEHQRRQATRARCGCQPRARPRAPSTTTCTAIDGERRRPPWRPSSPTAAERGAAEQPQHAVPAVEAGLDRLAGERGGDQRRGRARRAR